MTDRADLAVARLAAGSWGVVSTAELRACGVVEGCDSRPGAARAPAPPSPGCLRRGPRNVIHGRALARGCQSLRRVRRAEPLRRSLPSPLAQMGRPPDRRHLHQPPPASARSEPTRPTKLERIIVRRIPVTPRLRTIIDLARTEPEPVVKRALRAAKFSEAELERLPKPASSAGSSTSAPPRPPAATKTSSWTSSSTPASPTRSSTPPTRLELHPRPLVAAAAPARRSRQPRIPRGPTRPTRRPRPPSLARSQRRTRAQNHQAAGAPRPGAVLPTPQSRRSARCEYHTRMMPLPHPLEPEPGEPRLTKR